MESGENDPHLELAELVRSNVTGPLGRAMVEKAQRKLVNKMQKNGTVTSEEADVLKS